MDAADGVGRPSRLLIHPSHPFCRHDGKDDADDATNANDCDQDGIATTDDCDDNDANSYPGAAEICDEVDNNCNGETDENPTDGETFYLDEDGDGDGDAVWGGRTSQANPDYNVIQRGSKNC